MVDPAVQQVMHAMHTRLTALEQGVADHKDRVHTDIDTWAQETN